MGTAPRAIRLSHLLDLKNELTYCTYEWVQVEPYKKPLMVPEMVELLLYCQGTGATSVQNCQFVNITNNADWNSLAHLPWATHEGIPSEFQVIPSSRLPTRPVCS